VNSDPLKDIVEISGEKNPMISSYNEPIAFSKQTFRNDESEHVVTP